MQMSKLSVIDKNVRITKSISKTEICEKGSK